MKKFDLGYMLNDGDYNSIVFVPIRNFKVTNPITIGDSLLIPGEMIDKEHFIKNHIFLDFSVDDFFSNTFCILLTNFSSEYPFNPLTPEARDLFDKSISACEQYINLFKFLFSNIDYSTTVPTKPGYIGNSISRVFLYQKNWGPSMFITFKTFIKENDINPLVIDTNKHSSEITKFSCIFSKDSYEVGNVIKIALGQYANIVSSESKTTKFILSMTLLEFLADPFKYLKMQDVKKNLIPLITTNKNEAEYISNHFKFLTSLEDENGCQKGLRTNIIHMGKSIEDLVPNLSDIDFILRTLQKYICKVLENYYSIYDKGWNEVSNLIQSKKQNYSDLPYNVDNEISDTVILIDMKFLNIAIKEVHSLYNELKLTKNNALYFY